jgi:hypothetical protein
MRPIAAKSHHCLFPKAIDCRTFLILSMKLRHFWTKQISPFLEAETGRVAVLPDEPGQFLEGESDPEPWHCDGHCVG